ncbi:MAG: hypothetical protein M9936_17415 [Caldilinea sp.]|nr:hypothetical protein [Caldilinea sp.]
MFRTAAFRLPAIASLMIGLSIMFALTANLLFGQVRAQAAPPAQGTPPAGQEGAPVRVYFTGDAQLATLAAGYDIWEVDRAAGYAVVYADSGARAQLLAAGLRVEEDPIRAAEFLASLPVFPGEASAAAVESIPGYACYRTVEETYSALAGLATQHPDLAQWVDIGDSWEKTQPGGAAGYDLYALVLTNRNRPGPKPRFFLAAATHARELATAELATRFAEYLLAKYNVDPDVTWLLDYNELHLVAQANPDGRKKAEAGLAWRKNTDSLNGCTDPGLWGVDLNRNHSFKWGVTGTSSDPCNLIYRGPSAASEPEAQAIETYGRSLFADRRGPADTDAAPADTEGVMITLHSFGEMVLHSWGWSAAPAPNATQLATLGRKFAYYNGYAVGAGNTLLYATSGDMDDWFYGTLGVPAYTIELGTAFFQSCSFFESNIVDSNLRALLYAFKAARRPYQAPAGPEITEVTLSAATVAPGQATTLTAQAADNRYGGSGEPSQAIKAARYTIDQPSWAGGVTYPLSAADGAFDEVAETLQATVATTGLALGKHLIFVEAQDANGVWGVPSATFLTMTDQPPATATPTPTASPTPQPSPPPAGCSDLLANGGFETSDGWVFGSTPAPGGFVTDPVLAGARAARLGIVPAATNLYAYSSAYQRVTLPAGAQITLRYWERPGGATDGVDAREALVLNNSAGYLATLERAKTPGDDTWRQRSFDLSAYAGQRVIVYFNVYNDGRNGRAWNYLDSVEVLACTGSATPAPTPTPIATPTATPTPVVTPTPDPSATPPAACRELLANGDFEAASDWRFGSTPFSGAYSAAPVHGGAQAVRLGIPAAAANRRAYSTVYQRVTIPATTDQVLLTWWEQPGGAADGADYREVLLLNADYSRLRTVEKSAAAGDGQWQQRSFDLSAFAGRTVVLYFNVYNNGSGAQQWNHLDDVSLALCTQAEAATAVAAQPDPAGPVAADALVVAPAAVYFDDQVVGSSVTLQVSNRNAEDAPLSWQAETDAPWLSVQATSGSTPGGLDVSLVSGEAEAGIYQAQITLIPDDPAVEAVTILVIWVTGLDERLYLPAIEN